MSKKSNQHKFLSSTKWAFLAIATAFIGGASGSVFAQTASVEQTGVGDVIVNVNGRRLRVDPKTGKLKQPTREEAQAVLDAASHLVNQSAEKAQDVTGSDGSPGMDLTGAGFESVSVAKTNSDGSVSEACVTNTAEAKAFFKAKAKTPVSKKNKMPSAPAARRTSETAALAPRIKFEKSSRTAVKKSKENLRKNKKERK